MKADLFINPLTAQQPALIVLIASLDWLSAIL